MAQGGGLGPVGGAACDLCRAPAAWSCFTCLSSFCEVHARPHRAQDGEPGPGCAAFRSHRGRPAGDDAAAAAEDLRALRERERRCAEHPERPSELFCEACALCVCPLCPVLGAHRGHPVGLIGPAAHDKREMMATFLKQLALRKQQEVDNIQHIEEAMVALKAHALASKAWMTDKFTELRLLLEEEETLAHSYVNEKAEETLRAYEEQLRACEGEISAIQSFSEKVRQIELQPDPHHLLKGYSAIEKEMMKQRIPAEKLVPVPMSFEYLTNHFKRFMEMIQSILQKPLKDRLKEDIFSSLDSTLKKEPGALLKVNSYGDRSLFLKYARSPTLDIDSLHPRLTLSEDRLSASCCWRRRLYPCNPQRFNKLCYRQ